MVSDAGIAGERRRQPVQRCYISRSRRFKRSLQRLFFRLGCGVAGGVGAVFRVGAVGVDLPYLAETGPRAGALQRLHRIGERRSCRIVENGRDLAALLVDAELDRFREEFGRDPVERGRAVVAALPALSSAHTIAQRVRLVEDQITQILRDDTNAE